ncbi:NRDE family protein [Pseudomarimonas salicorniae]|uniref:NRDE family protein n=1 Tax=Pseudomarimonas salicorniae TaxID=2933270 RepID=A0ABT0GFX9_9GAMM|nr:NRDE family protein [Lysobacter sp. CAU 1642]MCK7593448.1 NRDE family protein [Lysobacter sp. CAU 1642]
MCLIALAWKAHAEFDLVLAGNRDEFHDRPAAPLAFDAASGIAGGTDLQAGGRWLGISARGRFAAVTNVRRGVPETPRPRSRGALVEDFLRGALASPGHLDALGQQAADYARFNLLVTDGETMGYAGNADGWTATRVAPGLHTLSNAELDTPWPKTRRLREALREALVDLGDAPSQLMCDALFATLQWRQPAPDTELPDTGIGLERERALSPPFVSLGVYGTRCSSLVFRRRDGRWWFFEQRYDSDGKVAGRSLLHGDRSGLLGSL